MALSPQDLLPTSLAKKSPQDPEGCMELGTWRDCPSLCGSARPPPQPLSSRVGDRGLFRLFSGLSADTGNGLALRTGPRPMLVLAKVEGGPERTQAGPCCSHTLQCLSDFFPFARAFWVWISSHAFVLPATLDSRPQCPLRHAPVWAVGYIAAPGRREQGTSGHDRALGCGLVAVTITCIPGLQPTVPHLPTPNSFLVYS